ncbi:MAG: sigma-70 family RNA polymerase sigma factor [Phycisphaerales bacterium]
MRNSDRSPFDQVMRLRAKRLAELNKKSRNGSPKSIRSVSLSPEDRELLNRLLVEPMDYMESPYFEEDDAERLIFDDAPEIPLPKVGWYQPAMEQNDLVKDRRPATKFVLTKKQEKALFRKYNYARFRVRLVQDELGVGDEYGSREPSEAEIMELLRWGGLASALREQIAESNLALVLAMARRTRMKEVEFQELVSEGNMALLRAIDKFNADLGNKFSTYACQAIIKGFSRLALKQSKHRERFPVEYDPSFENVGREEGDRTEFEKDCAEELGEIVKQNRAGLTDVERVVIESRFGIGDRADGPTLTLGQVGQLIGVGKERVRQIQVRALAKIRQELEEHFIAGRPRERARIN